MKISYNWLKSYLDINLSPEGISEILTDTGLEVEGLEKWESVKGGLKGIIIGKIINCAKHPNSDHLSLTKVDVGQSELLPIVCGAPNVAEGQKVVVATVGTTLYDGDQSFQIKKAKMRGAVSMGMICAEDEIGIGTSHDGIMVLDKSAEVGIKASDYFKIDTDYIFEIGLTPNRTDGMSHIGVARDIKAFLNKEEFITTGAIKSFLKPVSVENFKIDNTSRDIEVIIENKEGCKRYSGLSISDVKIAESPQWLKNRLLSIGLSPVNNVVDITNFVLHETGQPLHAFDADQIKGNKVVVKKLPNDTPFITLDNIERKLTEQDLMICNTEKAMCIGGVFGGIESGVDENTQHIFLESACFEPVHIRKTSKYHDLQTDASFRFERGVDPNMVIYALKRAALLIKEIAGGNISSDIKDVLSENFDPISVPIKWSHIRRLIGKEISHDLIKSILTSLDFIIENEDEFGMTLFVPTYRVDVTREADVIEEILRIYGYNNIPISERVLSTLSYKQIPDIDKLQNHISNFLTNNGFYEIMNNSLTKSVYYENSVDFDEEKSVFILNPLSNDLNVMRQSLLFNGLENIIYNINRKMPDLKFYEFGKSYHHQKENIFSEGRFLENRHLALFVTGQHSPESWKNNENKAVDFYQLKAYAMQILKKMGIEKNELQLSESKSSFLSYGLDFSLNNKVILKTGEVSKEILLSFGIKQNVFYADFNWDLLLASTVNQKISFNELPKYPEVRRDLSLLLDQSVTFAEIEKIAYKVESKLLIDVNLFDIYEGKKLPQGKKSYACSFILQDKEKTLRDKHIDKVMKKMIFSLGKELGAEIR